MHTRQIDEQTLHEAVKVPVKHMQSPPRAHLTRAPRYFLGDPFHSVCGKPPPRGHTSIGKTHAKSTSSSPGSSTTLLLGGPFRSMTSIVLTPRNPTPSNYDNGKMRLLNLDIPFMVMLTLASWPNSFLCDVIERKYPRILANCRCTSISTRLATIERTS